MGFLNIRKSVKLSFNKIDFIEKYSQNLINFFYINFTLLFSELFLIIGTEKHKNYRIKEKLFSSNELSNANNV